MVDDGFLWGLGGGYDFLHGTPYRAGFEVGAAYSEHDVDAPLAEDEHPELNVWRLMLGARVQADLGRALSVHVSGGGMWRNEEGDVPGVGNEQFATYVGAGLEWWFDTDATMGPFVLYTHGAEDGLDEWVVGLAARFYFDSKQWEWDF